MKILTPIILSGGSGTRLWPLSREKYPKQLLQLISNNSLLQATVLRMDGLGGIQHHPPIIVCNEEYRFIIAEQLRLIDRKSTIVLEPFGRNTAPALTLAALEAMRNGEDPVLLVMPSDHVIMDVASFQTTVLLGMAQALENKIVTFGITPDAPETGYGYIQVDDTLDAAKAVHRIVRFVEKPNVDLAKRYLNEGIYWWNSGLFMMRASVWLATIGYCRPDILAACRSAWKTGHHDDDFLRIDRQAFEPCPNDSIDYAVMERLTQSDDSRLPAGVMIPLSAGWSDIGVWSSLWQVLDKDEAGNVSKGDVLLKDCSNTLAISESRVVACVGVENVIVVETPDAVLVVNKDKTQDVKTVVDHLKQHGRPEGHLHRKVFRPWGWYDGIDVGECFQVKRIVVNPGAALSMQLHHHRAEHWVVVRGIARVTRNDEIYLVAENESTYIPLGTKHRLENPGCVPLEMIEVQSGSYLGEDDIVRFDDIYGRKGH